LFHFDITRPGMALYGLNPTPYQDNPMIFPIQILARVVQIRNINSHESVGYNQDFIAKRPTRIATLSVGYADGIPWNLSKSHKTQYVLFGTFKAPIIGRISMDLITVDITDLPVNAVHENDWACVFGAFNQRDWHYDDFQSPYEKLTGLGNRFKKQYVFAHELPQEHNCSIDNDSFEKTA
jgi:alanine racemase